MRRSLLAAFLVACFWASWCHAAGRLEGTVRDAS